MLELSVPGYGDFKIKYIVFDLNGTLAIDGVIPEFVKMSINELADQFEIYN